MKWYKNSLNTIVFVKHIIQISTQIELSNILVP
jgi:hypothetical protein